MIDYSRVRVLVVDDESCIRESLVGFLDDFDFQVTSAGSSEEALEILKDNPQDIAVMDLRLPGISGDAMIIKAGKLYPHMRFIIHTGSVDFKISEELKIVGMKQEHIFLKPLPDLTRIVDTISQFMEEGDSYGGS
ncbi:MAG: response regulator [bacterium]|nr:response regulator [bacterium]